MAVIERIDRVVAGIGRCSAWLVLAVVILTVVVVLLRYGFNLGWIWLQESVTYLHAAVFMLAAAWALQDDAHVRVDLLYRERPPRYQAAVNLVGSLVLLVPFCLFLLLSGREYVVNSWVVLEGSREAGGLPLVFLLKSLILVLPALLLGQGLCQSAAALAVLRGGGAAEGGE